MPHDRMLTEDSFPCVLPFSHMYPLCCIDIRNFLNRIYLFSDDYFQNSSIIDETLKNVGLSSILWKSSTDNPSHSMICFVRKFARAWWIGSRPSILARLCRY